VDLLIKVAPFTKSKATNWTGCFKEVKCTNISFPFCQNSSFYQITPRCKLRRKKSWRIWQRHLSNQ